ncbi:MAG: hypothetical protein Tsb0019_21180 [Roseibium sp.]
MRCPVCFIVLGIALAASALPSRAENGSCYQAGAATGDGYLAAMLTDLMARGQAFLLANGDTYAVFENLPDATICDLAGADLSDMDLSGVELSEDRLDGALLCNTRLPGGTVSRRDCR